MTTELIAAMSREILDEKGHASYVAGHIHEALLLSFGDLTDQRHRAGGHTNTTQTSYIEAVIHGLNPYCLRTRGTPMRFPYYMEGAVNDPMFLASYYAAYDESSRAESMLEEHKQICDTFDEVQRLQNSGHSSKIAKATAGSPALLGFRHSDYAQYHHLGYSGGRRSVVPPDAEDLGIRRVGMGGLDTAFHAGLFEESTWLPRFLALPLEQQIEISAAKATRFHGLIRDEARKMLFSKSCNNTNSRHNYALLTLLFQICRHDDAMAVAKRLSGVRAALLITRADLGSESFVTGLKALVSMPGNSTLIARMARGPTAGELRSIRGRGIFEVIDAMPWELVEPIQDELAAIALPHVESIGADLLKRFSSNHVHRVKRVISADSPDFIDGSDIKGWPTLVRKIRDLDMKSREFRTSLCAACLDTDIAALAAHLRLWKNQASPQDAVAQQRIANLRSILERHVNAAEIFRLIDGFVPPHVPTF